MWSYIISGPQWLPDTEDQGDKRISSISLESKSQPLINVNNPGNTEVTTTGSSYTHKNPAQ